MGGWWQTAIVVVAVAVSFLLSGMEAGVFALSRLRIRRLMRDGNHAATRLYRYLENPENFLWTIVVGNTVAGILALSLIVLALHHALGEYPWLFMASIVSCLLVLYAIADLLPKVLFRRFPNRLCLFGVTPFRYLHLALSPLVALAERFAQLLIRLTGGRVLSGRLFGSRAELRHLMAESSSALSSEELTLINRVLDLEHRRARDVMTPMNRAATLDARATLGEFLDLCSRRGHSHIPIWKGTAGERRILGTVALAGVLYEQDLERARRVEEFVQPALFVREDTRLEEALRAMQRSGQRLAVVLSPERRESGVITLHDILTAIFGEVRV